MRFVEWLKGRWGTRTALPPEIRLSKEAILTLSLHFCFQFGYSMAGVFMAIYLWRLTESLVVTGVFTALVHLMTAVGFIAAGKLSKKKDRLFTYRVGIVLVALFYLSVIIAQERVADFYIFFGLFNGTAVAFYWTGYMTLQYDVSTNRNRSRYIAFNFISNTSAALVGPALAGFIISRYIGLQGYVTVFIIAFALFVVTTIGSLRFRMDSHARKPFYLNLMGLVMRRNRVFAKALAGWFVQGILQGTMMFIPNLLLFYVVPREDIVGYLGAGFAGLGIITGYLMTRQRGEGFSKKTFAWAIAGYSLGAFFLLIEINMLTVIIFMALYNALFPIQMNTTSTHFYRLMSTLPLKGQLRVESVVIRETFVNSGRIITIIILLMISREINGPLLPWVIFISALTQFLLLVLVDKNYSTDGDGDNTKTTQLKGT